MFGLKQEDEYYYDLQDTAQINAEEKYELENEYADFEDELDE